MGHNGPSVTKWIAPLTQVRVVLSLALVTHSSACDPLADLRQEERQPKNCPVAAHQVCPPVTRVGDFRV